MITRIPIHVHPYHPLWAHLSKFIKDPRVQYAEGKAVYDISFDIESKKYRAKITHEDEIQSSFEVFQEIETPDKPETEKEEI